MLNIFKKLLSRKRLFTAIIFVVIIAVFLVGAKYAQAAGELEGLTAAGTSVGNAIIGGVGGAIALVVGFLALIITTVIGLLITVVVAVLIQVAQYGNIINVPTVTLGWVIVRDLCNMSFILILLIIAFATILRQENFSVKKLLPKLLLMAILINFSRTIFGLLIDFSQVIMLTFVNAFAAGGGWFIQAFQTNLLLSINSPFEAGDNAGKFAVSTWATAVAIIAGVLAAIITLIVVSIMLAVLVARIVMLWIYTIFSPLVFLGFAFPPLQKYTGKIWEDFAKQLVVGPVLAFFIWLALTTASGSTDILSGQNLTVNKGIAGIPEVCVGAGSFFCEGNFQKFIIVIGLLMGGLMVAQSMGGAAGSIAGKGLQWAKGVAGSPGWVAKEIGHWGSRKMAKLSQKGGLWSLAMLASPRALKEGWQRRKKEDEQRAFPKTSAKFQDFLNKRYNPLLGMGVEGKGRTAKWKEKLEKMPYLGPIARAASGEKTYNEKIAFEAEVASKQSEIAKANLSEVQTAQAFHGAKGEVEKLAWTRQVIAQNRQDDVARVLGQMYGKEMPGLEGRGGAHNTTAFRNYLRDDYFKEFGKERANEYLAHLAEYSEEVGRIRGQGLGGYNAKTGKPESIDTVQDAVGLLLMRLSRADAEKAAASLETAQFRTQEPVEVEVIDKVTGKTIKSIFSEMNDEGKAAFKAIPVGVAEQYNKSRKIQTRFARVAGLETDPTTMQITPDSIHYEKLAECYSLNKFLTESILTKVKFSKDELTKVQDNLNVAMPLIGLAADVDFSKSSFGELSGRGGKP